MSWNKYVLSCKSAMIVLFTWMQTSLLLIIPLKLKTFDYLMSYEI